MMVEHLRAHCSNGKVERLSVPPGFVSLTSFTLKRVENEVESCGPKPSGNASEPDPTPMDASDNVVDAATLDSYLVRRPWILYDQTNGNRQESDSERLDKDLPIKACLPKGVIRGCPDCSECLKVVAKWRPGNVRTEFFKETPIFHPTEEEFKDTVKYIASIRPQAEPYGICRIVPPWRPPCPIIQEKHIWEGPKFATKTQRIDGLQNQYSKSTVASSHTTVTGKRRRRLGMGLSRRLEDADDGFSRNPDEADSEPGPEFSLQAFKKYADTFKSLYFCHSDRVIGSGGNSGLPQKQLKPSVESIEGEYRRIVENPTEEIEVLCASDIRPGVFGSGFPAIPNQDYLKTGWNLNNAPKLPGSLLCFESCESSVDLAPHLHIGMCFSSLYWKIEDHNLYSLAYMHFGDPKVRYAIPGRYSFAVEAAGKKQFPILWAERPDLHQKLLAQLSISMLKAEGIPAYRCVQHQGEFVLVFPGAYHSGFDCGFNCVEAVNYAPIDWLPYGQNAVELYREKRRKSSISHDKMLLGAAMEAVREQWEVSWLRENASEKLHVWKDACRKDGILANTLKLRVKQESRRREYLCTLLQSKKMDKNFDVMSKRECCICHDDLHLSAVGCACSAEVYSCLVHAKQFCSCAWNDKICLIRHDISELNTLVEAVEGKMSAVFKWVKEHLGLSFSKESLQLKRHIDVPNSSAEHRLEDAATPRSSIGTDASSGIKAELKARLLQSASQKNMKPKEENTTTSTAVPSFVPKETKMGTRIHTFLQREVVPVVSPKAELKARLLQSASQKNMKAKEENTTTSTAVPSFVPKETEMGTMTQTFLQREVVPVVSPDSTSISSEYKDTGRLITEKETVVSLSVPRTKPFQQTKEDRVENLPSKALESTSKQHSILAGLSSKTPPSNVGSAKKSLSCPQNNVICLSDDD